MFEIPINPDDPASIQRALNTEWLLTNGLGGYAMGTVLGVNTRRYHGLLVAATKPPVGRIVALHSMIEQLIIPREDGSGGEEVIELSTQQFVGPDGEPMLHPNGWQHLVEFSMRDQDPFNPNSYWRWQIGDLSVLKFVSLDLGRNQVSVAYATSQAQQVARLRLRPLVKLRDFHALGADVQSIQVSTDATGCRIASSDSVLSIQLPGTDVDRHDECVWRTDAQWWRRLAYVSDRNRGQGWCEDVWSPGVLETPLALPVGNGNQSILQCPGLIVRFQPPEQRNRRVQPLRSHVQEMYADEASVEARLTAAAMNFIVRRQPFDSISVIAGYPWFGDWGRDTMISIPGLMLCTKRFDEAESCLLTFARHMRNGLIPNFFDDSGEGCAYNTVDASLWFVHAAHEYWRTIKTSRDRQGEVRGGARASKPPLPHGRGSFDASSHAELLAACRSIIAAYRRGGGTDFNIRMDEDGLITAGDKGSQLTWMDAKRDGVVFTPRHGKAVEINALWFNALRCVAEMSDDQREREELDVLSRRAAESFRAKFWWGERRCLHDVLVPREAASGVQEFQPDGKLRPNQIFAVSLPFSPLHEDQQRAVVKIVGEHLLTPFGLRTLDRDDPAYRGRFEGNLFERDQAYHNGTVWPWLIGPYCEALLRIEQFRDAAKRRVRQIIQPLIDEMENTEGGRCLGQIAEVYDGDPPQRPGGCPAQAWSVAEVLRILAMIESSG